MLLLTPSHIARPPRGVKTKLGQLDKNNRVFPDHNSYYRFKMLKNILFLSAIKLKGKKTSKKSLKIWVQSWYVGKSDLN